MVPTWAVRTLILAANMDGAEGILARDVRGDLEVVSARNRPEGRFVRREEDVLLLVVHADGE